MIERRLKFDNVFDCLNETAAPFMQRLSEAQQRLEEDLRPLAQALQRITETAVPYFEALQRISEITVPYFEAFLRYDKFVGTVGATGWLPYHTVSIDYVAECGEDASLLEDRLSTFYKKNWEGIRQDIEKRLDQYQISGEAKSTFREALSAHEVGHYRCVCRVLFPEIEKEIRIQFFEDKAGHVPSQQMLEKLTNRGSLEDFMPREAYGWILFPKLIDHLYEKVCDSNRLKYEKDYVPNRHASAHGLVPYSTHKHSMNMIIMADYVFHILTLTADLPSPQQ